MLDQTKWPHFVCCCNGECGNAQTIAMGYHGYRCDRIWLIKNSLSLSLIRCRHYLVVPCIREFLNCRLLSKRLFSAHFFTSNFLLEWPLSLAPKRFNLPIYRTDRRARLIISNIQKIRSLFLVVEHFEIILTICAEPSHSCARILAKCRPKG